MMNWAKWLIIGCCLAVVLLACLIVMLLQKIDTNTVKTQLAIVIKQRTGMETQFAGDISWSCFPGLSLQVHNVILQNNDVTVMIRDARIEASLLPALFGTIREANIVARLKLNPKKFPQTIDVVINGLLTTQITGKSLQLDHVNMNGWLSHGVMRMPLELKGNTAIDLEHGRLRINDLYVGMGNLKLTGDVKVNHIFTRYQASGIFDLLLPQLDPYLQRMVRYHELLPIIQNVSVHMRLDVTPSSLGARGTLAIKSLQHGSFRLNDTIADFNFKDDKLEILAARSRYETTNITMRSELDLFSREMMIHGQVTDLPLKTLFYSLLPKQRLMMDGRGDLTVNLALRLRNGFPLIDAAVGSIDYVCRNGLIAGKNLTQDRPFAASFQVMRGRALIERGVIRSRDAHLIAAGGEFDGQFEIDLRAGNMSTSFAPATQKPSIS